MSDGLRLVYCGTPQFAVPSLKALIAAGHTVSLVVSQPDRPVGRKQILTPPPVKVAALEAGIPVVQPEKIRNNEDFRKQLEELRPDAIIVVAYGRIIPAWMLGLPRLGCINLHGSLLPKYRGAAPIQWSVAMGDTVTGNTTMLLEEGLDTGPILLQQELPIGPETRADEMFSSLSEAGAPLLLETLKGIASGTLKPQPQDHSLATLAPILTREEGLMDFATRSASDLHNRWRGFQPWPGGFSRIGDKKFIVHGCKVAPEPVQKPAIPGLLVARDHRLFVACAEESWLEITELQLEGKTRVAAADFLRGNPLGAGTKLG